MNNELGLKLFSKPFHHLRGTDSAKLKEGWCELIPDKATSTGVQISNLLLMLRGVFGFPHTVQQDKVYTVEWERCTFYDVHFVCGLYVVNSSDFASKCN